MEKFRAYTPGSVILSKPEPEAGGWLAVEQSQAPVMDTRDRVGRHAANTLFGAAMTPFPEQYAAGDRLLTDQQLWMVYKRTPDVRAAVDAIVRRVATWDWIVEPTLDPSDPGYQSAMDEARQAAAFLQAPNTDGETWQELWTKIITDLMVFDSGVMECVFAGQVQPNGMVEDTEDLEELVALRGSTVLPVVDQHGHVLGYRQNADNFLTPTVVPQNGEPTTDQIRPTFGTEQIVYLRLFPNTATPLGTPLIETLMNEIVTMLRSSEHSMLAFDADEIPPGILVLTGIAGKAAQAAKADLQTLRGKDHKVRVITNPDPKATGANWVELRRTPKDVDFVNVVNQVRRTIWRVFGVLPVEMGASEDIPRAVGQVQLEVSGSHLINPILELLEAKINARILPLVVDDPTAMNRLRFRFDRESKLSAQDQKDVASTLVTLVREGIMTRNEARAIRGVHPIEGGDVMTLTTGQGVFPLTMVTGSGGGTSPDSPPDTPPDTPPENGGGEPEPGPGDVNPDEPEVIPPEPRDEFSRAVGDEDPTNFPKAGDDERVDLRNSQWDVFDQEYAQDLRDNYPTIWDRGGNVKGNAQFRDLTPVVDRGGRVENRTEEAAVRLREAWGARHFQDFRLPGVVAQIKWYVVGELGERGMKDLIDEAKRKVDEDEDRTCDHDHTEVRTVNDPTLPSSWQSPGPFSSVRTLDLVGLHDVVSDYTRIVTPLWQKARTESVAAIRSVYRPGSMSGEDAEQVLNRMNRTLDKLATEWNMGTEPLYMRAGRVGLDSARDFTGQPVLSDWRQRSLLYSAQAMSYLNTTRGLISDLRVRLTATVNALTANRARNPGETPEGLDAEVSVTVASEAVEAVFIAEQFRIQNYSGKLVELANATLTDGMLEGSSAVIDGQVTAVEWFANWVFTGDQNMCVTCATLGAQDPILVSALPTVPGAATECGARCRCVLVLWTREEVDRGTWRRVGPS